MEAIQSSDLIKNIGESVFPENVVVTELFLKTKYGYTLRISMLLQVLKDFLGITEFTILDERISNNGPIESYCIDQFISWKNGNDVNFSELFRNIKKEYTFSGSEKLKLEEGNIEEKLWAFFLALSR